MPRPWAVELHVRSYVSVFAPEERHVLLILGKHAVDRPAQNGIYSTRRLNMVNAHTSLDQTLMALADPTRRAILQRLSRGEARVTELANPFDMSLNAVSKHIRILERADLVRRRTAGREHFLSFNRQRLDEVADWIETQRAAWNARLDALEALLREEDKAASSSRKRTKKGSSR